MPKTRKSRVAEAIETCLMVPSGSIINPHPVNVVGSLNDIGDQLHTLNSLLRQFLDRTRAAAGPEPPGRGRAA